VGDDGALVLVEASTPVNPGDDDPSHATIRSDATIANAIVLVDDDDDVDNDFVDGAAYI